MTTPNELNAKFDKVFNGMDKLYEIYNNISDRLDRIDLRFDRLEKKVDRLEQKVDQNHAELIAVNAKMDDRITSLETWRTSFAH